MKLGATVRILTRTGAQGLLPSRGRKSHKFGEVSRSRTGLTGFATLHIAALPIPHDMYTRFDNVCQALYSVFRRRQSTLRCAGDPCVSLDRVILGLEENK